MGIAAIAGLAMSALSTGMSVMGKMQEGQAASAQAGYQAAVARNNQITAGYLEADALKRGKIAEEKSRQKFGQLAGTQQAQLAAQGTELSGSALDILGDTAAAGEYDVLNERANAAREAWGFKVKGLGFEGDARAYEAKAESSSGLLGAGSSLIAGGASFADKWMRYKKEGLL